MYHELLLKLFKGVDAPWLEAGVLDSSSLSKCGQEGDVEEGISFSLDFHGGLVSLQVIQGVGGPVIEIHLWHVKLARNQFLLDLLEERGASVIACGLSQGALQIGELMR